MSKYILMQIQAMWWGPIQTVYYIFRGLTFFTFLPWNTFVLFINVFYLPMVGFFFFIYFLKAVLWWMDVAYLFSNAWINNPEGFITKFF
jgi:hypothetical protein